ncbi:hypothetical protein C0992_007282 [Termitomyces sp. T32_za158]|nr:hypothetical protein C0992_007282 [Termitomyces sp. T32_za158]
MAGETILGGTYGLDIQPKDDPYIQTAAEATHTLFTAAVTGAFLVDLVPILKYVPDWMPFADFKRKGKQWRKLASDMINLPYDAIQRNIKNGDAAPSFVLRSLQNVDESQDIRLQEYIIKSTAGSMYTGESLHNRQRKALTVAAIESCILGLLENPTVVKKAQEELDRVVGPDHLPTFDDEGSLPFITAIVKEALRWRDVTPIDFPRGLSSYPMHGKLYAVGKCMFMTNMVSNRAMLHDEDVYPNPFDFNPDRFMKDGKLNPDVKDPDHAAFGFGRR